MFVDRGTFDRKVNLVISGIIYEERRLRKVAFFVFGVSPPTSRFSHA